MGVHEEEVRLAIDRYTDQLRYGVMRGASLEEAYEHLLASSRRQFARHPDVL